jgi:hypothetical protein
MILKSLSHDLLHRKKKKTKKRVAFILVRETRKTHGPGLVIEFAVF